VDWLVTHWDDILVIVGAIGVACESLVVALHIAASVMRSTAQMLGQLGLYAESKRALAVSVWLAGLADSMERASDIVPRLRGGKR